ncbi:Bax inhibitor-1/YccA family protein [Kocuria sp. CPCC 205300]|uniref:Bax inhibitor-1/YccA family protein n=1 Tax=Kocuria sabuli TaxID=3071448 RepID=UPI0036DCA289
MAGGNPLLRDFTKQGAGSAQQSHGTQYGQSSYGTPYQQPGYGQGGYQQGGYGRPQQGNPYSADRLDSMYNAPAAGTNQTGRMTYDDVIMRTATVLGAVVVGALAGWIMPILTLPGALIGFVLAMVNVFKRQPSPALILAYGLFEGMFLGGISSMFEIMYPGIAVQAVIGTLAVFGSVLVLFRSGKLRASPRATKIFMVALMAYVVFALVNLGAVLLFGFNIRTDSPLGPWLGLAIGAIAILLAAYSFVLDFENIKRGVEVGVPEKMAWSAAFGLTVTLVWLYIEILRILAIIREMTSN